MRDNVDRMVIDDWVNGVLWPATVRYVVGAGGQQDFDLYSDWNIANDVAIGYINGNRQATPLTWVDANTVRFPASQPEGTVIHVVVSPGAGSNYLPRSGALAMTGNLQMGTKRVTGLGASVNADDAVRRDEVAGIASAQNDNLYLRKNGANWPPSANLAMGTKKFTGLGAGSADTDSVTKAQMDAADTAISDRVTALETATGQPQGLSVTTTAGADTWTKPAGVQRVRAILVAGGGGGAGGNSYDHDYGSGGGGGGGDWTEIEIACGSAEETWTFSVGAGGNGGAQGDNGGADGADGGDTSLTVTSGTLTAAGGKGGKGSTAPGDPGNGGAGGSRTGAAGGWGGASYAGTTESTAGTGNLGTPGARGLGDHNAGGGGGGTATVEAFSIHASASPATLPHPIGGDGAAAQHDAVPAAGGNGAYGGGGGGGASGGHNVGSSGGRGGDGLVAFIY